MSTEITITSTTIDINVTESPITIEAPSGAYPLPNAVDSVFGRTGNVVATEGDYTLTQLAGVTITSPSAGQALVYNGTSWVNNTESYVGTVTSVAITETGDSLNITGSPITTSGTINIGFNGTNLQYVNGAGNLTTFPILTGYVPYTGATQDVDLGAFKLNAQSLHAKGTGGLGHLGLKHQSASATASANEVSLFADSLGDLSWLNGNLYLSKFITSSNTAARSYTFPNANGTVALTSDISYPVTSVFGRTGAVVATSGDYTTTQVTEGTNLYFTDTRARAAISLTTTGTSGAATYTSGVINIPQYQGVLTNPVTGTGTTNTLPKFTAASTIGNSNISDNGSLITLGSNSYVNGSLAIGTSSFNTYNKLNVGGNATGNVNIFLNFTYPTIQSDVTSAYQSYRSAPTTAASVFTLSSLAHYIAINATLGAGSVVTNQNGFFVDNLTSATNNYGFYGNIASGTNRWNLYMNGTADNYLAGKLGIGSPTLTNVSLRLAVGISGSTTSHAFLNVGTILSDVTTLANYNMTSASTQAAAFTLSDLIHYRATQGTFGAGSTVTNQAGFVVESSVVGGTNNYAFQGNIPSGTNRWNLYMNGTANNYIAGSLGIGTTSLTAKLDVRSSATTGSTASPTFRAYAQDADSYFEINNNSSNSADIKLTRSDAATMFTVNGHSGLGYLFGQLGIGVASPNASAKVQIDSTTSGFLPPRVTTTQKNAIATPATGLMVYDTTLNKLCVYTGTAWETITSA